MTATVILDRDGTLLDFYEMFHQFVVDLHTAEDVVPPSRELILSYEYWTSITVGMLRVGSVLVRDRVDDVAYRYMTHGSLYPGAAETLRALAGRGVRLAVVSSWVGTDATAELLRRNSVHTCVEMVLTRDDLPEGRRDLSDAECKVMLSRRVLDQLGHGPGENLFVVGDTAADVALGRQLRAHVIGVRTGNGARLAPSPPAGPDVLLESVADLAMEV
jgi:phosphoglycolate phosphatase-like HAD superfamily hydrolase